MKNKTIFKMAILLILAIALIAGTYYYLESWPVRFSAELDSFFGEGNWEVVSSDMNESLIYEVHHYTADALYNYDSPGTYTNWDLLYTGGDEEEVWTITNHTYKINNSKYFILSSKRYSAKQALIQQLMEISCSIAAEEIQYELLTEVLTTEQADCLRVNITYRDGNPPPSFYTKLAKQDWFTASGSSAAQYLESDLYDFYIDILAFDYKVSKLSDEEQADLMESLDEIEQLLVDTYGEYADYYIYLGEGYSAETNDSMNSQSD